MKKILILVLVCFAPLASQAHNSIVPHVHDSKHQNTLAISLAVLLSIIVGIGAMKLYRKSKVSGH